MRLTLPRTSLAAIVVCVALCPLNVLGAEPAGEPQMPVGGLLVHLGCGSGERLISFAAQGCWLLHGLDADEAKVARARTLIQSKGLAGIASVEHWTGSKLPYADNLVNVLIADDPGRIQKAEILRVLAPGGFAKVKGETVRKPWPKEMDGWTHVRHGADGNPVSKDTMVGVTREIRWVLGGAANGWERPLAGDGKYYLGRNTFDAFNGLPLWRGNYAPRAAGDGRVYGMVGGNVVGFDAATGAKVGDFGAADAKESVILYTKGRLLVATPGSLRVCDVKTGKPIWQASLQNPRQVVIGGENVFVLDGKVKADGVVLCLELSTGKEVWKEPSSDLGWLKDVTGLGFGAGVLAFEVSPYADGADCTLHVISATDGKVLWSHTYKPPMGHRFQARALFLDDDMWIHKEGFTLVDALTGKKERSVKGGGGHCFPAIATVRYLIHGECNLTDAKTGKMEANRITKGTCTNDPFIPANGLLYSVPKGCICFPMVEGHLALAPSNDEVASSQGAPQPQKNQTWDEGGMEKGPANGAAFRSGETVEGEWPMYRHDNYRTGGTKSAGPAALTELWRKPAAPEVKSEGESKQSLKVSLGQAWITNPFIQGRITAPVVAGGRVFVAESYAHRVVALNAASGDPLWQFTANGVIDTPPTVDGGRVLFGTRSGWVYCLAASSGELVWRTRATPEDKLIVAWGAMESAWPVSGSVVVNKGIVFAVAGRSALADGGIHVTAIQADSGRVVQHHISDSYGISQWYGRLAHDYDPVDLLAMDGEDRLVMSRTRLLADKVTAAPVAGGAFYRPGKVEAYIPVGIWSYGLAIRRKREHRPLYVFQGGTLYGGEAMVAYTPPAKCPTGGGREWNAFQVMGGFSKKWSGPAGKVEAITATEKALYIADASGEVTILSTSDGKKQGSLKVAGSPVWDGMAVAYGRVYLSLENGSVACLGTAGGTVPSPEQGPARTGKPPVVIGDATTPEEAQVEVKIYGSPVGL